MGDSTQLEILRSKVDAATGELGARRARKAKPIATPEQRAIAQTVLDRLGDHNGVRYTASEKHVGLIATQLRNGVTELELRAVVAYCAVDLDWKHNDKMRQYLRPETLFGPESIAKYLDPARTAYADRIEQQQPTLRRLPEAT